MKLFIDTQGLLSYFGEDTDIGSLEALESLLKAGKVKLFHTAQLQNEYLRDVGNRIDQTRQAIIKDGELQLVYKAIEDNELKAKIEVKVAEIKKVFEVAQKKRVVEYEKKVEKTERLIERIFASGEIIDYTDTIIQRAKLRHIKGNPPKKKNDSSYGDAINWESILELAVNDDLVLISSDPDYLEKGVKGKILNRVLTQEWQAKSKKRLSHYLGLGAFINSFERKRVISAETIRKENTLVAPYLYDGKAIADALSAIRLADSAYLTATASLVSNIPNITNIFTSAQGVYEINSHNIARAAEFSGLGNVFPPNLVIPASNILSANITGVETKTLDLRTPDAKKKDEHPSSPGKAK